MENTSHGLLLVLDSCFLGAANYGSTNVTCLSEKTRRYCWNLACEGAGVGRKLMNLKQGLLGEGLHG